jgi:hypothetical protein
MIFGWTDDLFRHRERELRDASERLRSGRRRVRRGREGVSPERRPRPVRRTSGWSGSPRARAHLSQGNRVLRHLRRRGAGSADGRAGARLTTMPRPPAEPFLVSVLALILRSRARHRTPSASRCASRCDDARCGQKLVHGLVPEYRPSSPDELNRQRQTIEGVGDRARRWVHRCRGSRSS